MKVCVCGGGALGHCIAGWISGRKGIETNLLTRNPGRWDAHVEIGFEDGVIHGNLSLISDKPSEAVGDADVVILCLPGAAIASEVETIAPYLKDGAMVGSVFGSSGFFFEAIPNIKETVGLWALQRVPFIARVTEYGHRANILGTKPLLKVATERRSADETQAFVIWLSDVFETKVGVLNHYLEATISNSNPILHTGRLYSMFAAWDGITPFDHNILFYEEWTDEASALISRMDDELFRLIDRLPVSKDFLVPLLPYYDSSTPSELTAKIRSIESFKGIVSPMKEIDGGWGPDFSNRYFTEDFGYSLRYIYELAREYQVSVPTIDMVYEWGRSKISM